MYDQLVKEGVISEVSYENSSRLSLMLQFDPEDPADRDLLGELGDAGIEVTKETFTRTDKRKLTTALRALKLVKETGRRINALD